MILCFELLPIILEPMGSNTSCICIVLATLATSNAEAQFSDLNCRTEEVRPIKRAKATPKSNAVDWTTMASTYTHDQTGQRVDQFASTVVPHTTDAPDYVRSGYRHTRSTLQAGFSSDHYHMTEQWGQNVQPYGQWRYPYRPFSVPYDQWGPQLPQSVGAGFPWLGQPIGPWPPFGSSQHGSHNFGPTANPNNMLPNPNVNGFNPAAANGTWIGPGNQSLPPQSQSPWHPGFGGAGGFGNGFNVGPWNTLPASQDEYYPQAPSLRLSPRE
ncbi:MAG: hypothetical protein ABL921_30450 [Pirellula sp.]